MLVKDLIGAELDFYVAKAEGKTDVELRNAQRATNKICVVKAIGGRQFDYTYSPSTQWSLAGPIIERETIPICPVIGGTWAAEYVTFRGEDDADTKSVYGPTALIAAMRCYVASVFGDEVESIKED